MRRRAPDPSASLPGQKPMFADEPAPIPPREERAQTQAPKGFAEPTTLAFAKCPKCGLKQSRAILANAGGKCAGCDTAFTPEFAPDDRAAPRPAEDPVEKAVASIAQDFPKQARQAAAEEPAVCATCAAPLTVTSLGKFHPCGHGDAPPGAKPPGSEQANEILSRAPAKLAEWSPTLPVLTVTWGEEKFTPVPGSYSTYSVGPFSITGAPNPGEPEDACFRRLYAKLAVMAEATREAKKEAFLRVLRESGRAARES